MFSKSETTVFADDITVYVTTDSNSEIKEPLNLVLERLNRRGQDE